MARQGMTIVMAEHKVEWVAEFADRVLALTEGDVLRLGDPKEVLSSQELQEHGAGLSRYTQVARRALQEGSWPENRRLPVTLEEGVMGFREVLS
jgi:ABC-type cobalamin transport system ATPase subunit